MHSSQVTLTAQASPTDRDWQADDDTSANEREILGCGEDLETENIIRGKSVCITFVGSIVLVTLDRIGLNPILLEGEKRLFH